MTTINNHYIYPHHYDGYTATPPRRYVIMCSCVRTTTGNETDVIKIVMADLLNQHGVAATKVIVENIKYSSGGFTSLELGFDNPDGQDHICFLGAITANGEVDFTKFGGHAGEGNIILTSQGGSAADTYSILITFRVK